MSMFLRSQNQRVPRVGRTVSPIAAVDPGPSLEQQTADALGGDADFGARQRGLIDAFYNDPMRQQEIQQFTGAGLQHALAGLDSQLRGTSRQQAFRRAATGNIGGSVQAGHRAGLEAMRLGGAAQAATAANQMGFDMNQQMQARQHQELMATFGIDPFIQQMIQERLAGLGVEGSQNAAMFGLDQSRQQMQARHNDELSRAFGNLVNLGGQAYTIDQRAGMLGRQGVF